MGVKRQDPCGQREGVAKLGDPRGPRTNVRIRGRGPEMTTEDGLTLAIVLAILLFVFGLDGVLRLIIPTL